MGYAKPPCSKLNPLPVLDDAQTGKSALRLIIHFQSLFRFHFRGYHIFVRKMQIIYDFVNKIIFVGVEFFVDEN